MKTTEGAFNVEVTWEYEDSSIRSLWGDELWVEDAERREAAGELTHYVARVTYSLNGCELGTASLGSCLAEDPDTAIENGLDGYLDDMMDEARAEAINNFREMAHKIEMHA